MRDHELLIPTQEVEEGEREEKRVGGCGRQNSAPPFPKRPGSNPWNL